MAIFSAVSTDSEPEFVKNTRSIPGGAISTSRLASSNAIGWPIWKVGANSIVVSCLPTASAISRRPCPAFTHQSPATPSSTCRPSSVQ